MNSLIKKKILVKYNKSMFCHVFIISAFIILVPSTYYSLIEHQDINMEDVHEQNFEYMNGWGGKRICDIFMANI